MILTRRAIANHIQQNHSNALDFQYNWACHIEGVRAGRHGLVEVVREGDVSKSIRAGLVRAWRQAVVSIGIG